MAHVQLDREICRVDLQGETRADSALITQPLAGEFITLSPAGSVYTIAYGINDAGQIAGAQGSITQQRSFLDSWTVRGDRPSRRNPMACERDLRVGRRLQLVVVGQ